MADHQFIPNPLGPIVLAYHAIGEPEDNPLIASNIHNIIPENFTKQIQFLKNHFDIIFIDELSERCNAGQDVSNCAAVTFDDGYQSVVDNALPILQEAGVPSTIFLTTSLLNATIFWRDKVRFLIEKELVHDFLIFARKSHSDFDPISMLDFYRDSKNPDLINSKTMDLYLDLFLNEQNLNVNDYSNGIYISFNDIQRINPEYTMVGNHGHHHYLLSSLSYEEQYDEIKTSLNQLQDLNLDTSNLFSIPNGNVRDYDIDTLTILTELGYSGVLLCRGYRQLNTLKDCCGFETESGLVHLQRFMPQNEAWI